MNIPGVSDTKKPKAKFRETYLDELLRAEEDQGTGQHLGPGTHNPLPVERVFQQPEEAHHGPKASPRREHGGGGQFNLTERPANYTSLKHYPRIALPSSVQTPGPGSYTQFTSFGASSGPTRKTYLPKAEDPKRSPHQLYM